MTIEQLNPVNCRRKHRMRRVMLFSVTSALVLQTWAAFAQTAATEPTAGAGAAMSDALTEVVVTAQRRTELASKVPISIATYTQEEMDKEGVRTVDDLARLTPALNFSNTIGSTGNNGSNISIRGVASDVGSSTTAIYIDDTPIQIRNVGYFGGNPYPRVFDLERVEVLRGPQGTLFGAGAEGGAVRFITPQPDLTAPQVYARTEGSGTEGGTANYEAGISAGSPLSDQIAIRASAWYRRDGGYIDQINPTTGQLLNKNVNSQDTYSSKVAATWQPNSSFSVTPSLYYQQVAVRARDAYWEGYGDPAQHEFVTGTYDLEPSRDAFYLPALRVNYVFTPNISLISNTSYFDRTQSYNLNYITYQSFLVTGNPFGSFPNKDPGNSDVFLDEGQENYVQEARLESSKNVFLDWTAGVYYSKTRQRFTNMTESGNTPGVLFGGLPQNLGRYSWVESTRADDNQISGYGNFDLKFTDTLKVSAGARYTYNTFDFFDETNGPIVGNVDTVVNATQKEGAFTPKFTVSYQATSADLFYATAAQGFRPGGAQPRVDPSFCAADLAALHITQSPSTYNSDSLWNFEVGTKNRLYGGAVRLDASVYLIKWNNIQQSVNLPTCGFNYVANLGSATGKGGEVSFAFRPFAGVQLGTDVGYTHMAYDSNIYGGSGVLLKAQGQRFGGPLWSGSVYAEADRPINDRVGSYARIQYSFTSENSVPATEGTFGYDPGLPPQPSMHYATARVGTRFNGMDWSAFVDNLTNSTDLVSRNHDGLGSPLYYAQTFRPRTIGVTAQFRY
jgi:iron complex outermembrane receptor protein